jgi:succinate-semialdehyde dehydrogenase / glutarate-semialdehyde dehydrogenase
VTELPVIDPTTGQEIERHPAHDDAEVDRRLDRAVAARAEWRSRRPAERTKVLRAAAQIFKTRAAEWAELMAREMGKPLAQGRAESEKCAWVADYYADQAESMLADEMVATDASKSYVHVEPLGTILAIMPWNFPFWQVLRSAAPSLTAGNTFVLKHAENVPGCALALEAIFREAGAPEGVFTTLLLERARAEKPVADPRINAVALTGSERAGMAVAAIAGQHLKRCVLELGGSDPFVVLEDADLDRAAQVAATARCQNSGQSCIAAKRFVIAEKVADPFLDRFKAALSAMVVGDPRAPATTVGPMARADLRAALHDQVERTKKNGGRVVLGGEMPSGRGFFYPVTLVENVARGMAAWDEETFGPVAAVRVVRDEEAAIAAANETVYGLGASVWTQDRARGERIASRLAAGAVFVNGMVKSDPRLPFGGVKRSGYGSELSWHGLHELVTHKTVWVG